MQEYIFGLYDKNDKLLDATSIDEHNPDLAIELFKEFGWDVSDKTVREIIH